MRTEIMGWYARPLQDSDLEEVYSLSLRDIDRREVFATTGKEPAQVLKDSVEMSCEAWVICNPENEIIAVFGLSHHPLNETIGIPWLLATDRLFDSPKVFQMTFLRTSREMVRRWNMKFPYLTNIVSLENEKAIEWLSWLGFNFGPNTFYLYDETVELIIFYREIWEDDE
jgi:hypothetical protein